MAVHIYTSSRYLPEHMETIDDSEDYFHMIQVTDCEFTRRVLKEIDKCEYVNESSVLDRFGKTIYLDDISAGSKILLNAYYNRDKIFRADELGMNARVMTLTMTEGHFYFENGLELLDIMSDVEFILNGSVVQNEDDLWEVLW